MNGGNIHDLPARALAWHACRLTAAYAMGNGQNFWSISEINAADRNRNIEDSNTLIFRMHRAGIPCPEVVKLKKHVLVMSFIGADGCAAPRLKEVDLDEEQLRKAYNECVQVSFSLLYLTLGLSTQCFCRLLP